MTPAKMLSKHNPPESWGDCTRACVASVFDLPSELVPHFAFDGYDPECPWVERLSSWLKPYALKPLFMRVDRVEQHEDFKNYDNYYLNGGKTKRGTMHDTVWFKGEMVYDPHPTDPSGLTDEYPQWVTLFVDIDVSNEQYLFGGD